MKNHDSIILAALLVAGALGFISCAGHPVKSSNSQPFVSVMKSEQESNPHPAQTTANTSSPAASTDPTASTASPLPNYASQAVAITAAVSSSSENLLALLLLVLALLVLWFSLRQIRKNKKQTASPVLLTAPRKVLTPEIGSLHNGILLTSAGATHLLHAKHNYQPIVPVNHKDDIQVSAFYYDQIHKMHFAPNTTIQKVTGWAAYQCQISEEYLEEVYLTIRDYFAPLRATAHIAHFVPPHRKHLELDVKILARMRVK